jgi:hypothetical protein
MLQPEKLQIDLKRNAFVGVFHQQRVDSFGANRAMVSRESH